MAITSAVHIGPVKGGLDEYEFTDTQGRKYREKWRLAAGQDAAAFASIRVAPMERGLAKREIEEQLNVARTQQNPDKVAEHQTQAEFDRRLLAALMLEVSAYTILASLPFWTAVEGRGGSNANQRAAYLGVTRSEYDQVANRFSNTQGAASYLNDEKGLIWTFIPRDWR